MHVTANNDQQKREMMIMVKPELLLPAGNLEKLKTAFIFGADAVYIAGEEYGLRAYAHNFSAEEMIAGVEFAHLRDKKVYVAVNILAHNEDIEKLPAYLSQLQEINVDGLIISDLGVIQLARQYAPDVPITVSTQASVTNYQAAACYQQLGARRIVLARELSLQEIKEIKKHANAELEVFIHGAMCVSYSGRCLLSYFMTGRSANRGACAHPCRYKYVLQEEKRPGQYYPIEEDQRGTYILNSRDLCLLEYLPDLIDAGIDAFKIEGRMKSPLYIASVASTYRQAIDRYTANNQPFTVQEVKKWMKELHKTATRPFTTAFMSTGTDTMQDTDKNEVSGRAAFCGIVKSYDPEHQTVLVEQRANFGPGDNLELLLPSGEVLPLCLTQLFDEDGQLIDRARHARQKVIFNVTQAIPEYSILRSI